LESCVYVVASDLKRQFGFWQADARVETLWSALVQVPNRFSNAPLPCLSSFCSFNRKKVVSLVAARQRGEEFLGFWMTLEGLLKILWQALPL
jgi:hypothetical protein